MNATNAANAVNVTKKLKENQNLDIKTFETRDTELAAYLMLEGLKFFECKVDPQDKTKGIFVFFDEKSIGRDLERNFVSSEMKKFCDRRKYLLKEVFRTLKGLK